VRTIETYEKELVFLRDENRQLMLTAQSDNTRIRVTADQLTDENRHLVLEIKNLRDVLLESSIEMERCKEEFIRLDR
jgi:regulator of replication initiation timing